MQARLVEVQKRLLTLLFVSLAIALLVRPELGNRRYAEALREVEAFRTGFVQKDAEAALQRHAASLARLSLADVVAAAQDKHGPKLKLLDGASAPAAVSASPELTTLGAAQQLSRSEAGLMVALPDASTLGTSLAWRLSRAQRPGIHTLTGISLVGAEVSEAEADLDPRVGELRSKSLAARAAADDAARRVVNAERRVEKRAKRRSRSLDKAEAQLSSARSVLEDKTSLHNQAQAAYDAAARSAEAPRKHLPFGTQPRTSLALIQLKQGAERIAYEVPVRLVQRSVAVPGLRGAEFQAVQAAGLWDEVRTLDAAAASAAIESRFNWHFRKVSVGGVSLSGAKLLQLVPCLVPVLLGLLLVQMRRAETFYSPFSTKVPSSLPRVGFKHRSLEFAALIVAPLLAPVGASIALVAVQQLPLLPLVSSAATLTLGSMCFIKLADLREQAVSIVRTNSYPPPAADLSTLNMG
jgi:hypothetical protein